MGTALLPKTSSSEPIPSLMHREGVARSNCQKILKF